MFSINFNCSIIFRDLNYSNVGSFSNLYRRFETTFIMDLVIFSFVLKNNEKT